MAEARLNTELTDWTPPAYMEGQEDVIWDDWRALAGACEEHGVETLFRSDHYLSVEGRGDRGAYS
jgi:hypothetical protein